MANISSIYVDIAPGAACNNGGIGTTALHDSEIAPEKKTELPEFFKKKTYVTITYQCDFFLDSDDIWTIFSSYEKSMTYNYRNDRQSCSCKE
ncbi:hypothetical protein DERP_007219 [Dermatophagoides pteronyssinus]|uniref:Uncharacterized protein n=1 Tax=Dermatophagoides pteronyssinus TaxID=6956 RepID=A0ABQ8J417_DERPT|nr:hypothetical protein DERP_007219 [Dermatophagoides pteronyssinus]